MVKVRGHHAVERVAASKRWDVSRPRTLCLMVCGCGIGSYRVPAGIARGNRVGCPGSEILLLTHD